MRKFGLIGYPLTHSFSQKYFTEKFITEGIDAVYENFSMEHIHEIRKVLEDDSLEGFNITIPHKEHIIPYLDVLSDVVMQIQACNCVRIMEGKLHGFNTDIIGFEKTFEIHLRSYHQKALVLGTGGASKAVCYVLKKKGIHYQMVSRNATTEGFTYNQLDEDILQEYTVIINTTPLGMYPDMKSCPSIPFQYVGSRHYLYDLIYNPAVTSFLHKGKEQGAVIENGKDMLVIQAEESWRIWNS